MTRWWNVPGQKDLAAVIEKRYGVDNEQITSVNQYLYKDSFWLAFSGACGGLDPRSPYRKGS